MPVIRSLLLSAGRFLLSVDLNTLKHFIVAILLWV
jgi:hypothetical protein